MQGDVTKLPKWAQDRIRFAESQLENFKKKQQEAAAGKTEVFALDSGYRGEPVGLPAGSRVAFQLAEDIGKFPEINGITVRVNQENNCLEINSSNGHLLVIPWAANAIKVKKEW
jgi:hypothetical protein